MKLSSSPFSVVGWASLEVADGRDFFDFWKDYIFVKIVFFNLLNKKYLWCWCWICVHRWSIALQSFLSRFRGWMTFNWLVLFLIEKRIFGKITRKRKKSYNFKKLLTKRLSRNFLLLKIVGNVAQNSKFTKSLGMISSPAILAKVPFKIWMKRQGTSSICEMSLLRGGLSRKRRNSRSKVHLRSYLFIGATIICRNYFLWK